MSAVLKQWFLNGKFFPYQQYELFYKAQGRGETLVLIHGYPTSSLDWQKVWTAFAAHYRVIALDLLGFGFSDKPAGYAYSVMTHADMLEALFRHLNLSNVHIVAHDLGVGVAQELLARRIPGQYLQDNRLPAIASVVFMNGGLFAEAYRPRLIQKLFASAIGPCLAPRIPKSMFKKAMRRMFGTSSQPNEDDLDIWFEQLQYKHGQYALYGLNKAILARAAYRHRLVAPLQQNLLPMLLLNGTDDPNSGAHMAQRYRELVPNAQVIELAGIGHWPMWEAPEAVFSACHQFIQQVLQGREAVAGRLKLSTAP